MGQVIAVLNQKGGVAKTSTVVNCAAAFSRQDAPLRVLVVDLDSQGHACKALGVPRGSGPDIGSVLWEDMATRAAIRRAPRLNGIDVLAGSARMGEYDVIMADDRARFDRLARTLQPVRGEYDIILLDLPPGIGLVHLGAYVASDRVVAPLQPEADAVDGLIDLRANLERARVDLGAPARFLGALITMADLRTREHRENISEIRDVLRDEAFDTVIRTTTRVREASRERLTVLEYAPESTASADYIAAAVEMGERIRRGG